MSSTLPNHLNAEVVVVGAGPVGLALAGDLAWRGHQVLLIEKGDGSIDQPRMDLVGIRTMEFCRRWGIVKDVEESAYDRNYPQDNVYLTSLTGFELGRQAMPSMNEEKPPKESPQKRERCPQNYFDPILKKFALSQKTCEIHYFSEITGFTDQQDQVSLQVKNLKTEETSTLHTRFLVGCDGAKSFVRESLGIDMHGKGLLTYTTNVIFRCPEFNSYHDKAPGYRYMIVGPSGTWCTIVAINGKDQWRMSLIGSAREKKVYTKEEIIALAHQAMGQPFDFEILSVLPWQRAELVADAYRAGNVFICGDACHLTSPTGGLGMNTGIGDAVDLSWKLSALLQGWGGDKLLESYFIERQPIAKRITQFSTGNLEIMKSVPTGPAIHDNTEEGEMVRFNVGTAMSEGLKREWFSLNMHLGNRYTNSPINLYDEVEDPENQRAEFEDAVHYKPSSRVGARAPHVWLTPSLSTLDLTGKKFSLFCLTSVPLETKDFEDFTQKLGIPMDIHFINSLEAQQLFTYNYVMVRPDGHIAWRGDYLPIDMNKFWSLLTGQLQ